MQEEQAMAHIAAVIACPTGIAHCMMAAEALQTAATRLGHTIEVETQSSAGAQNVLGPREIAAADVVVIAAGMPVDTSRFAGKPIYTTTTRQAIHAGEEVIATALNRPAAITPREPPTVRGRRATDARLPRRAGPYQHLMTGVSYMLPIVVAGGLCIALAFAIGGIYPGDHAGTVAAALNQIGHAAFDLFVAVLSAFIAYSIADRPGIAPGLIGGFLAQQLGAGYLGAVVSGFVAGYFTRFLARKIKLPPYLAGLMPVLILPFFSTLVVGLLMIFVVGPEVRMERAMVTSWLNDLRGTSAVLLGVLLGAMMAFDMGGPVNKAAYAFAFGLLSSDVTAPMAAVMAAGMTPPLGMALATFFFKNRFDLEERTAAAPALALGLAYITEGAIPFAAKDPLRVIPSLMFGSAIAGGLSMFFGVQSHVPHGGIFAALIPGAIAGLPFYLLAIVAGALVTVGAIFMLKRPKRREEPPARPAER
jgi:PTS system fructose-specific IIC component